MPQELFPYQVEGGGWVARRLRCGLLDVPGLGKSAQIVRALDMRPGKRGLVICPAHLRSNWRNEFAKFGHVKRLIGVGKTMHDFVAWSRGVFDVLLLSYEMAVRWAPRFHEHGEILDFIHMDEAHYLSNSDTQRTVALLGEKSDGIGGLLQWSAQSAWVTGTLMTGDPAQCFTFLRFCGATTFTRERFLRHFFHSRSTTWGQRNKPKVETLPELQSMIATNSIRRTFEQVGIQLPPIFLTELLIEGDTTQVRQLLSQHPGLDASILQAVESGGLSFLDNQQTSTLRRLIGEAKAIPYADMLISELEADPTRKVVVMGIHRDALTSIRDALAKRNIWAVLVIGGMTDRAAEDAIQSFQNVDACRVWVGNKKTGLTLTAAAHVDLVETDWRPAENDQAIKRVRRIGQRREQHARFITLANSFDEKVNEVVVEKTRNIAAIEGREMIGAPESS